MMIESLCVFCGSRAGNQAAYAAAAEELGKEFARLRIRLVYGGGNVGIMGVLADAVLDHGGEVTGVIPEALLDRELAHARVRDMHVVESMHARKALMAEQSQGFIALPGGLGTFEELCEVLTWRQLGFHRKPIAVLNVEGYFNPLLEMLDRAVSEGLMTQECRDLLYVATTVPDLIACFIHTRQAEPDQDRSLSDLT